MHSRLCSFDAARTKHSSWKGEKKRTNEGVGIELILHYLLRNILGLIFWLVSLTLLAPPPPSLSLLLRIRLLAIEEAPLPLFLWFLLAGGAPSTGRSRARVFYFHLFSLLAHPHKEGIQYEPRLNR